MPSEILVKGATLKMSSSVVELLALTPPVPNNDVLEISTIVSMETASGDGEEMIVFADIENALSTYLPSYSAPGFTIPGTLGSASGLVLTDESQLVKKNGEYVSTAKTEGQFFLLVTAPATNESSGTPHPPPGPILIEFKVDSNPQTLVSAD